MKIFERCLLSRKYSFFRDYVETKKELEKYSNLESLERIPGDLKSEQAYMQRQVIKEIAHWGLFDLIRFRSRKGVRMAKFSLEGLSEEES